MSGQARARGGGVARGAGEGKGEEGEGTHLEGKSLTVLLPSPTTHANRNGTVTQSSRRSCR